MEIEEIAGKIKKAGGKVYLVGGSLRDNVMGRESHDQDYCVTGLSFDEFLEIFPEAIVRGKSFQVFDLYGAEFAIARIERKSGIGHKEFEVYTDKNITIEEDLARRDITINSIAKDVLTGKIIDPYGGTKDIESKCIRATTNCFKEDPLRVYRVARFASCLEFDVEKNTIELMKSLKGELLTLSKERVFEEFRKAIRSNKPSIFFEVLKQADILDVHFLEIYKLIGALQPEKYHPEGDSYVHTMQVLDRVSKMASKEEIRFAGLVHDLGKGATPKNEYPHHYGHDKRGIEEVHKLSKRIGVPSAWEKCGVVSCKEHMLAGTFFKMKPEKQVRLIERVNNTILGLKGLQTVVYADRGSRGDSLDFYKLAKECLKQIDGKYIKEKYNISEKEGIRFKEELHKERVKWMKDCNTNVIF